MKTHEVDTLSEGQRCENQRCPLQSDVATATTTLLLISEENEREGRKKRRKASAAVMDKMVLDKIKWC